MRFACICDVYVLNCNTYARVSIIFIKIVYIVSRYTDTLVRYALYNNFAYTRVVRNVVLSQKIKSKQFIPKRFIIGTYYNLQVHNGYRIESLK